MLTGTTRDALDARTIIAHLRLARGTWHVGFMKQDARVRNTLARRTPPN
jgi:hypothetical protein